MRDPDRQRRPPAGKPDLSQAVSALHARARRVEVPVDPRMLDEIPDHLLLAAGDEPGRGTFFEHDDSACAATHHGRRINLVLGPRAALPDYRTREGRRTHRSMITIPPKLRESIRELFGASSDSDVKMTTAIVALADYAAMALRRDEKCLYVEPVADPLQQERKKARRMIRRASRCESKEG